MRNIPAVAIAAFFLILTSPAVTAQSPASAIDFQGYRPVATAKRIDPSQAPKIDGDLSDPAWKLAAPIKDFYQNEPKVGTKPSQATEAWILYDNDNLYVAFRAHDTEPGKIARAMMTRDGQLWKDDVVRFALDPQDTKRHGYAFEVSSGGARGDSLIQNNTFTITEWNTIWDAKTRIDDKGWTAEFIIPFRSLSFNPNAKSWGFQMGRSVVRNNEPIRWSNISNSIAYYDMSRSGRLEGVNGIEQGLGLDIEVLGATKYKYDWDHPRQGDLTFEPSANVFYKLTPSLTGTLTFNTDFSDAPLDTRQVNTGRFGLFIPESRDFFLQDASLFEFGGQGLADDPNGRPFFSRNIGITDFGVVDIVAGGKLSGAVGNTNIAALTVKTAGRDMVSEKTLGAMRIAQPLFERTQIGAIFTFGDPSDDEDNFLGGVDFQHRDTNILPGRTVNADFYWQRSSNEGVEDDAYGFELSSYEDDIAVWLNYRDIGENFAPELGFVNRTGIRQERHGARYRVRPKSDWLSFYQFEVGGKTIWTSEDHLDTRNIYFSGGMATLIGDEVFFTLENTIENITSAFFLPDSVLVPAAKYDSTIVSLYAGTSRARWIAGNLNLDFGEQYGGDYFHAGLTLDLHPSPYWSFDLRHDVYDFDLATGGVTIHVDSVAVNINFTPDMTLTLQSEYDNISAEIGISARLRWEFLPGAEMFASLGNSARVEGRDFTTDETVAALRIGNTFRF
jgi:hypothetical protein